MVCDIFNTPFLIVFLFGKSISVHCESHCSISVETESQAVHLTTEMSNAQIW